MSDKDSKPDTDQDKAAKAGSKKGGKAAAHPAPPHRNPQSPPGDPGDQPPWQLPDYSGPLTITQAQWRLAHIKPSAGGRTK